MRLAEAGFCMWCEVESVVGDASNGETGGGMGVMRMRITRKSWSLQQKS